MDKRWSQYTNANSSQYTIVSDDYGKVINLNVKYIDNLGYNEDLIQQIPP